MEPPLGEASAVGGTNARPCWPGTGWLSHIHRGAFDVGETEKVGRKVDTEMLSVQQVIKKIMLLSQSNALAQPLPGKKLDKRVEEK